MNWSTPADLKRQLERRWDRGQILAARLTGEPLFPLRLRLNKPGARELAAEFDAVRSWIQALTEASKPERGFGYEIEWRTVNHRVHGRNQVPDAVVVSSEDDALRWLGKTRVAGRFNELSQATLARYPALADWLAHKPLLLLQHAGDWARILAVLDWFCAHPRPRLYLRQLDIPEVDSKFIERRRGLLMGLLDQVLPERAIERDATGIRGFSRRYGLREAPPLIRFRVLDPALMIGGLSDLSVPPVEFAALRLPVERVFITENKINGLAFPPLPGALVIFGLGYGLDRLQDIAWLQQVAVHYWGDIDTHGFAILHRLRASLPHAGSFLMDRATLLAHRALWGQEGDADRFTGTLSRLSAAEQTLFDALKQNRFGEGIRLEQERIAYSWLQQALSEHGLQASTVVQ